MNLDSEAAKAVEQIAESFVDAWNRHDARDFAAQKGLLERASRSVG